MSKSTESTESTESTNQQNRIATEEDFYKWLDTCPTEWVDKDYQPNGWVRITFYYDEKEGASDDLLYKRNESRS